MRKENKYEMLEEHAQDWKSITAQSKCWTCRHDDVWRCLLHDAPKSEVAVKCESREERR